MVLYRVSVSLNKRTRFSYESFGTDELAYDCWYESRTKEESGGAIIFEKVDPTSHKVLTGQQEKIYK
jgi:hypothetical protein